MPRAKADVLTGGTKDVNPQWMKLDTAVPDSGSIAAGGHQEQVIQRQKQLPVNRINVQGQQKTVIIEMLKVRWSFSRVATLTGATGSGFQNEWTGFLSTKPLNGTSTDLLQNQGTVLDWVNVVDNESAQVIVPITTIPATVNALTAPIESGPVLPIVHDLTDGAGHGILVATDQMTLIVDIINTNTSPVSGNTLIVSDMSMLCEILYRFKEVPLTEYIGIVQSQQ